MNRTLKMEHTSVKQITSIARFIWYREHHQLQLELAAILNLAVSCTYSRGSYEIVRQRGTSFEGVFGGGVYKNLHTTTYLTASKSHKF